MSKRILLIDSDEAFAQGLSHACNERGFVATMATNSEQGMTLAKQENPDLIVVCVEAQPTNGYMLCTRLKKDEQLKGIPVILTSANATADSFEKHKKLKTRAEEYLIKPFEPQLMLEKASALLGVALPEAAQSEEIVEMQDESLGLGDLVAGEDEPIHLTDAEVAQAHAAHPAEEQVAHQVDEVDEVVEVTEDAPADGHHDDDLKMFDQAFEQLESKPPPEQSTEKFGGLRLAPTPEVPAAHVEQEPAVEAEAAADHQHEPTELSAPDDDAVLHGLMGESSEPPADEAHAAHGIDPDAHAALQARVEELETELATRTAELEAAKKGEGSSADLRKLKEARTKADKEVLRLKEELHSKETELVELQEQQTELESQAQQLKDDAVKREGAAKALQQRADALAAAAKKFERELTAAREELKQGAGLKGKAAELEKLGAAHEELQKKHAEAQIQVELHKGKAEQLSTELSGARELHEGELERLRADLAAAQAEAEKAHAELDAARTEVAALTGEKDLLAEEREDLRQKLDEAQSATAQNEERAVKAYQKIKADEKLREKTRKALQIALQLLDENAPEADDAQPEKQSA